MEYERRSELHGIRIRDCSANAYETLQETDPGLEWCCTDEEQSYIREGLAAMCRYGYEYGVAMQTIPYMDMEHATSMGSPMEIQSMMPLWVMHASPSRFCILHIGSQ